MQTKARKIKNKSDIRLNAPSLLFLKSFNNSQLTIKHPEIDIRYKYKRNIKYHILAKFLPKLYMFIF